MTEGALVSVHGCRAEGQAATEDGAKMITGDGEALRVQPSLRYFFMAKGRIEGGGAETIERHTRPHETSAPKDAPGPNAAAAQRTTMPAA